MRRAVRLRSPFESRHELNREQVRVGRDRVSSYTFWSDLRFRSSNETANTEDLCCSFPIIPGDLPFKGVLLRRMTDRSESCRYRRRNVRCFQLRHNLIVPDSIATIGLRRNQRLWQSRLLQSDSREEHQYKNR
jgi:hypothetical protein